MVKSKKVNNKIFNKTKKIINNNSDILKINSLISDIKKSINIKFDNLTDFKNKSSNIIGKMNSNHGNVRVENLIEDLSASNLRELNGDFSKKLRYKDLQDLNKINRESVKIIEEQEILFSKEKILNIELLQKQIEILLNDKQC